MIDKKNHIFISILSQIYMNIYFTESSDEGITADYDELSIDDVRREMVAMKCQLERERRLRIELEKHSYPSNIRELANQVQIVQMQTDNVVCIYHIILVLP